MHRSVTKALATLVGLCAVGLVLFVGCGQRPDSSIPAQANGASVAGDFHASFSNGRGFVHEYEVEPGSTNCPVHGTMLKLEYVPVIGGMMGFRPEAHVPTNLPFGRVAAYSGGCIGGGQSGVYRCRDCVEANAVERYLTPSLIEGADLWRVPEAFWHNENSSGVNKMAFYLVILPPKGLSSFPAGSRTFFKGDELVFGADGDFSKPSRGIATAWNKANGTVRIGNTLYDLNQGNCFLIAWQEDGTPLTSQIPNLPADLGGDDEVLSHFKSQIPNDSRVASLKLRHFGLTSKSNP